MPRSVAIVIMAALAVLAAAGCSSEPDDSRAGLVVPEPYRAQIRAVEVVLYQDAPAGFGDIERASAALRDLHEAIMAHETGPRARSAANELLFLSARADASDVGYAIPSLHDVRSQWERARDELFGETDWFLTTTPDVIAGQTPQPPRVDPDDKAALIRTVDRLAALIEEGRDECDVLGEPVYEPGMVGREGRRQIEAWNRFYRDWDKRITRALRDLPPSPALDGVTDYVMAHQEVGRAISELRHVPTGVGSWATPFEYQWAARFNTARNALDDARTRLARLP